MNLIEIKMKEETEDLQQPHIEIYYPILRVR